MKLICIDRNIFDGKAPGVFTIPDSSWQKDSRPFFIPNLDHEYMLELSMALRICKVGRKIAAKFAHRYFDSMAPAINFIDSTALSNQQGIAIARGFDAALCTAPFTPDFGDFSIRANGTELLKWNHQDFASSFPEAIETASRYFTLKTGDLILPAFTKPVTGIKPDTKIEIINNTGSVVSAFNIK